jgi:hypothetical protein
MIFRLAIVVAVVIAGGIARGDEAVRRDGSKISGSLAFTSEGRFAFRNGDRAVPVADLEFVRFATKPPAAPPLPLWHQVCFPHGEVLLAEVRKLDANNLHVRPVWADVIAIPRTAIERVTQAAGWQPVFVDPFDGDLSGWTKTDNPRLESGQLVFNAGGQAVEAKLKSPLATGRVGITFRSAISKSRTLSLRLGFERQGKTSEVHIELVGPGERYAVTSPAQPEYDGRLKRDSGTRRLSAEFEVDRLNVFLDELVLWTQSAGPGVLRSIRLAAAGDGSEPATVDHVVVTRSERPREPKPWADLTADAMRSPDGDETFGTLLTAGPAGVTLEVRKRQLVHPWPDVSELTFRRGPIAEQPTTGEHVRVRVRTAEGLRDVLDGAVKRFDDKGLVLAHAVLGELTIPRDRLEEIRLLFHGRRVPVDATPHHLGSRPAFGFAIPKPEGLRFGKSIKLDVLPAAGFVVVDAAQLSGSGTPVEVRWNSDRLGDLNRFADRAEPVVRSYRLPIPGDALRRGESEIEISLRPNADGRRVNGVDVRAIRLELHDPR